MLSSANGGQPAVSAVHRVALVGLPGSGKSAVGRALAQRLGWRHVDTDELIASRAGSSVVDIFASEGEAGFRARELAALREALGDARPSVLSCGGGLVAQPETGRLLFDGAWVVWLDAADTVLLRRLGAAADRPLLRDDPAGNLQRLRAERAAAYSRANLRVDVDDWDVDEVVDAVVDAISGARLDTSVPGRPLAVDLGSRSYAVSVDSGMPAAVDAICAALPKGVRRVAVVCDRAVGRYGQGVARLLGARGVETVLVRLAGGEQAKTWTRAGWLLTRLGVNLPQGKNLAGAFWQPRAVVCDVDVLATVPERDWRAAFAEIVKYPMIAAADLRAVLDRSLDALLARDPVALVPVIARCCEVKAAVVSDDEREAGRRAILNYGHTVGHALETVTGHGDALVHGEAVAAGMRVAGLLSVRLRDCPADDVRWQDETLHRCGLGAVPPAVDADSVIAATRADKKSRAGAVRWVLLDRLGAASFGHVVPEDEALRALREVERA